MNPVFDQLGLPIKIIRYCGDSRERGLDKCSTHVGCHDDIGVGHNA